MVTTQQETKMQHAEKFNSDESIVQDFLTQCDALNLSAVIAMGIEENGVLSIYTNTVGSRPIQNFLADKMKKDVVG